MTDVGWMHRCNQLGWMLLCSNLYTSLDRTAPAPALHFTTGWFISLTIINLWCHSTSKDHNSRSGWASSDGMCAKEGTTGHKQAEAMCEQAIRPGWLKMFNHHQGEISITGVMYQSRIEVYVMFKEYHLNNNKFSYDCAWPSRWRIINYPRATTVKFV